MRISTGVDSRSNNGIRGYSFASASSRMPSSRTFCAPLPLRSCTVPHSGQRQRGLRSSASAFSTCPQAEQVCAAVMDACFDGLAEEKRLDVLAALLSGDQNTFELFRCEAPELVHLPEATFQWYCENYLDRDYPLRTIMRLNGVEFPEKLG